MLPDHPDLPVRAALPTLRSALLDRGAAVLVAPPGTGKTTLVPLALHDWGGGRVLVAEPRRIAARAAARRMAHLTGGRVGDAVGYAVRGERRAGPSTVVEVVTTGVLLRRLQRDPDLPGVGAVVVDECHERHLDADLLLALLADVRAGLREDLRVLAASATAQADLFADVLGGEQGPAPVVTATVPVHDLQVRWAPPPSGVRPSHGTWVDPRLLDHVVRTTADTVRSATGDALVIVPGAAEVDRVRSGVAARLDGVDVVALHGRLPAAAQDAALRPGARRRVVVATAVAESSLTVPGVRVVVDAGLARRPRTDHARGLSSLTTTRVSRAEADQRAGRANREGPGLVVRCWTAGEHDRLPPFPPPEVDQADLTAFALELACWGTPGGTGLRLPTPPPPGPLAAAHDLLTRLGALDDDGRVTPYGRRLAGPAHPRLAHALLTAGPVVGAREAAEVVALLAQDRLPDGDLTAAWRQARRERPAGWRQLADRFTAAVRDRADHGHHGSGDAAAVTGLDDVAGLVVATAFPERVARRRGTGGYLMAGGTAATLPDGSALAGVPWLAVASADRGAGRTDARVRTAVAVSEDVARTGAASLLHTVEEVTWTDGDVVARRQERLGAIVLQEKPLRDPPPDAVRAAVQDGLRREGTDLLTWSATGTALRARMAFLHRALGDPWPDVSDAALAESLPDWLPGLERVRRRADLAALDTTSGLRGLLPWPQARRLDEWAPERIAVPSGSTLRVDYGGEQPVLAVRVQEVFGWSGPAALADGRVPVLLHLLSPAGRPAAVTADLESFWQNGYPAVRADLRGRYPRHPWPEDPTTAEPTRGVRRRR